jgi:hypothetical protein
MQQKNKLKKAKSDTFTLPACDFLCCPSDLSPSRLGLNYKQKSCQTGLSAQNLNA